MNIYVGNLSYDVTEEDLKQAFSAFGQVLSAALIKDKFTGQSRGFGFVEMPVKAEGDASITGMNGKELKGRTLTVNEARPKEEHHGGGRSGGKRFGGGGGRGFGGGGGRGFGGGGGRGFGGGRDSRGGGKSRGGGGHRG